MTTTEFAVSSMLKSEPKTDGLPPVLDLINVLTLAEDIAADPGGREAKRFAGQIIEDCEDSGALATVRALAEQIRESSSLEDREALALQIVGRIEGLLAAPVEPATETLALAQV